jgi:uncharacterized membrane protein
MIMLWLIIGLLVGASVVGLAWFTQARGIRLKWYEWLIAAVVAVLAMLAIQNFDGSLQEFEPEAAWLLLGLFGVPAVVLAAIDWFLVSHHKKGSAPARS